MPQLHLPRASYYLFVYDFRYDFSGTAEYNSMQRLDAQLQNVYLSARAC